MGGKDDSGDTRSDLDRWFDGQRTELEKRQRQFEREIRSWRDNNDDTSSPAHGLFERFKHFIDSNISTFSDGFRNFPTNISELKAKMQQEREARRLEEMDVWQRWTGSEDSPDHIKMQVERQSSEEREMVKNAAYMLLRESFERNKHVAPSKILALYRDKEWNFGALDQFATPMLSMGGACYYKTETVENLPSTARWAWSTSRPQWLSVDWFKRSTYSPVRLEGDDQLSETGVNWRAAFEDLLCATLDKPMVSEEKVGQRVPHGKPQSTYRGPGLEWMLSLQCRGILPPQLPSLYKPVSLFDGFDEVKRPRTVEFMHDMDQVTSNSKSARMYPGVKRDLHALMDEIAIKSGPETEARPLPIAQTPWRVPETEQELYEAMPPYIVLAETEEPIRPGNGEVIDGDDEEEDDEDNRAFAWGYEYDRPQSHAAVWPSREAQETSANDTDNPKKPDILSQLTTTQTTRKPDGTVITKIVMKQRFADGTEETHESVQTSRGEAQPLPEQPGREEPMERAEKTEETKKKQNGWFWN